MLACVIIPHKFKQRAAVGVASAGYLNTTASKPRKAAFKAISEKKRPC